MPFQVGHTINEGRHTKAGVKRIRAAFVRLYEEDPRKLDQLAAATHRKAMAGDVAAATFIRDTLDGKPATETTITHRKEVKELSDAEIAAQIAALTPALEAEKTDDDVWTIGASSQIVQ